MEPSVEQARVAGELLEVVLLSLLLLGWSWFVGQRARAMRKAEDLARMPRPNEPRG
jgi:hypothetical protein